MSIGQVKRQRSNVKTQAYLQLYSLSGVGRVISCCACSHQRQISSSYARDRTETEVKTSFCTTKPNLNSPDTSHPIVLSKQLLFKVIREFPRGSAAGPSGWQFEHFKFLIKNATSIRRSSLFCMPCHCWGISSSSHV